MAFITINADFKALVRVAEQIRDILARAFPEERPVLPSTRVAGVENLTEFDIEAECVREEEEVRQRELGLSRQR